MPITNPQAISFSNAELRPAADLLGSLYFTACRVLAEWSGRSLAEVITNTADEIVDGAATDGRPVITGIQATNIINRLTEIKTSMEENGGGRLATVLMVAVNPR